MLARAAQWIALSRRFHRELQPYRLGHGNQRGKQGFPRADKARYRLSRSMPAALATLAMPPRASAIRRKAIRSTLGWSPSSNAARRYSATNSGFSRSSRTVASSWDMLALRFIVATVTYRLHPRPLRLDGS